MKEKELEVIRTLANTEQFLRKAERTLIDNMFMPLSTEEHQKVFLEIGKNIVKGKEDIQDIKARKVKELINKHNVNTIVSSTSEADINTTIAEFKDISKVVTFWISVVRTGDTLYKIVDKYTNVSILEADIMIVKRIIKEYTEMKRGGTNE